MQLSISSLRAYIGRELEYGGNRCIVIDVLEDGPQLVLRAIGQKSIQADQWGEARRRTPDSFAVSIYEQDAVTLNSALNALLSK